MENKKGIIIGGVLGLIYSIVSPIIGAFIAWGNGSPNSLLSKILIPPTYTYTKFLEIFDEPFFGFERDEYYSLTVQIIFWILIGGGIGLLVEKMVSKR